MDKLKELLSRCKCGVYVSVNEHRDMYESVEDHLSHRDIEDVESDVFKKMIETNTIIHIQYYPDTPIGFYSVYHYDLNMALDEALDS